MVDLLGKNAETLKNKRLFLFDMDGTIYEENRLFDGTLELMNYIHKIGGEYIFITNNSSKSVEDYINKLENMGIPVTKENFFTSSQATALYLTKNFKDKKVFCMGTKSLINELLTYGIDVTVNKNDDIDVVLVGFDTELTYSKLRDTCELLFTGLPFIATNPDRACPVQFGFIPDCGAICEAIYFATNRRPLYIGKPDKMMIEYVVQKSVYSKDQTVVIGDRLYTDIASGVNANVSTICVLTGETKINDLKNSDIQPDFVFSNIREVYDIIKK